MAGFLSVRASPPQWRKNCVKGGLIKKKKEKNVKVESKLNTDWLPSIQGIGST